MHTPLLITSKEVARGGFHHPKAGQASLGFFPTHNVIMPNKLGRDMRKSRRRQFRESHAEGGCRMCLMGMAHVYTENWDDYKEVVEQIREAIKSVEYQYDLGTDYDDDVAGFNDDPNVPRALVALTWNTAMQYLGWDVPAEFLDPECL